MAIVRSQTGKFYDMDENALEGKEVKPEDLPKEMQQQSGPPGRGGGLAGLIQIIVNSPQGAPPPGAGGGKPGEGAEGDVAGHHHHMHMMYWQNCWHNCWRNCGW